MDLTLTPPDLTTCDQEVIHAPGAIQPFGLMLVAELDGFLVRHAAGDIERRLGVAEWQGQPLGALIGPELSLEVTALVEPGAMGGFAGKLQTRTGETLDVSAISAAPTSSSSWRPHRRRTGLPP